jgi:hypothetical protein
MAAKATVSKISAKARAADVANLRKARAKAKTLPRTAKQKNASRQSLVKARSAQKARRSGKKAVSAKKPQAALDRQGLVPGDPGSPFDLHSLPACAVVAVAASLADQAGIAVPDEEILVLHNLVQGLRLADLLEYASVEGFAGVRLKSFHPADPDLLMPGLVYGVQLGTGYHAVLRTVAGMMSWGLEIPLAGYPEEAWMLEWEEAGD